MGCDSHPTLTPSESESQSELLGDAYSSCHLWVRQNQLTFLCGLEMKEVLRKARDGGSAGKTRVSLRVWGHPRVLHRGTQALCHEAGTEQTVRTREWAGAVKGK